VNSDGSDPLASEAEEHLVSALVLRPEALLRVGKLGPEDFYNPRHRAAYEALRALSDRGAPVDLLTLADEVNKAGLLEAVGGMAGLAKYMIPQSSADNVPHYSAIIRDHALGRRFALAANGAAQQQANGADWRDCLINLRGALQDLEDDAHVHPPTLRQAMAAEVEDIHAGVSSVVGLSSGLGVERVCPTGLPLGFITTICAETGHFKTTLISNLAWNMAAAGHVVVSISFEDSTQLGAQRALGRATGIGYGRLAARNLDAADRLVLALHDEEGAIADRVIMEDQCEPRIEAVLRLARYYKRTRNAAAVIVDYLQLLDGQGTQKQVLDDAIQRCQRFAKQERMAVVLVSQVKAEVTNRKPEDGGPRPTLDDCLGSSAIRIGTKLGLGLFRPWRYCKVPLPKNSYYAEYARLATEWPDGNFLRDIYPRILEVSVVKNVLGEAPTIIPCLVDLPTGRIEPLNVG
jgi:replicative DNA helicase